MKISTSLLFPLSYLQRGRLRSRSRSWTFFVLISVLLLGLSNTSYAQKPSITYPTSNQSFYLGSSSTSLTLSNTGGSPSLSVSTLVGSTNGYKDGISTAVQFVDPTGVAVDPVNGYLYVADWAKNNIRKVVLRTALTSTFAGSTTGTTGTTDGNGTIARFSAPARLGTDASGNVYIADQGNNKIRKITPDGTVSTLPCTISLSGPSGDAVSNDGTIYVADANNSRIVRISQNGTATVWATGLGTPRGIRIYGDYLYVSDGTSCIYKIKLSDGTKTVLANGLNSVRGVAIDNQGNVYAADGGTHTIKKIATNGTISTVAGTSGGSGSINGIGTAAKFNTPSDIDIDADGNLYVADRNNYRIRKLNYYAISPNLPEGLHFNAITGAITGTPTVLSDATTYTISGGNDLGIATTTLTLSVINPILHVSTTSVRGLFGLENTVSSASTFTVTGSGLTHNVVITAPTNFEISVDGNTYADNTTINASGTLSTTLYVRIKALAAASFSGQISIESTDATSAYVEVAGTLNVPAPNITYTTPNILNVGTPISLYPTNTGGNPTATQVSNWVSPFTNSTLAYSAGRLSILNRATKQIAEYDVSGLPMNNLIVNSISSPTVFTRNGPVNLYIADANDGSIYKYNGTISTIQSGFGSISALAAKDNFLYIAEQNTGNIYRYNGTFSDIFASGFSCLAGIAIDNNNNVYVSDATKKIYKITGGGIKSTLAGDNGEFGNPAGIAVDANGNVYVTDVTKHSISKVTQGGVVTTVAGSGVAGTLNGSAKEAQFIDPTSIAVDNDGNLYVAETSNLFIRKISYYSISPSLPAGLSFDPLTGYITGTPTAEIPATNYTVSTGNEMGVSKFVFNIRVKNPTLNVSTTSISGLQSTEGTVSTPSTFTISGSGLSVTGVTISVAEPFEISTDGKTFATSTTLPSLGETLANTTVYVRLNNLYEYGSYSETITISNSDVLVSREADVEGTIYKAIKMWTGSQWLPWEPIEEDEVIIAGDYKIDYEITCSTLTVNKGVTLQINPANNVYTNGGMNNGIIICKSPSNDDVNGAFVMYEGTFINKGTMTMERYRTFNSYYNPTPFFSSIPVTAASSAQFLAPYVFAYNQSTGVWTTYSGALSVGKGYQTKYSSNAMLSISGTFNYGTFTFPSITKKTTKELMGNPYPCPLDWDSEDWTRTNISPVIQYYNTALGRYATYNRSTKVATNGGTATIPAMAGFYVTSTAANTVLSVTNYARIGNTTASLKSARIESNTLQLKVSGNSYTDETCVAFQASSTADFDVELDATKLFEETHALPHLYTQSTDNQDLTINTLPATDVVPVFFKAGVSGTYVITANDFNFDNYSQVFLLDTKTGKSQNLKLGSLTFEYTSGENAERFQLIFNELGKEITSATNNQVATTIYANKKMLYVNATQTTQISVYDATGRTIYSNNSQAGLTKIALNVVSGVYVVKVVSGTDVCTKKIVLE